MSDGGPPRHEARTLSSQCTFVKAPGHGDRPAPGISEHDLPGIVLPADCFAGEQIAGPTSFAGARDDQPEVVGIVRRGDGDGHDPSPLTIAAVCHPTPAVHPKSACCHCCGPVSVCAHLHPGEHSPSASALCSAAAAGNTLPARGCLQILDQRRGSSVVSSAVGTCQERPLLSPDPKLPKHLASSASASLAHIGGPPEDYSNQF